jgi:hypothetical protein
MATKTFGAIEHPEQLNLSPFKFTLVGYRQIESGLEEVQHEFTCAGCRPFYTQIELIKAAAADKGVVAAAAVQQAIEESLLNDEERARFGEALGEPGVYFEDSVMAEIGNWLTETYTGRPTQPHAASSSGRVSGGRRSTGGAGGRASGTSAKGRRG